MTATKSERYRIREMELEYEADARREALIGDLLKNPRIFYVLMMGGSGVVAWIGATIKSGNDNVSADEREIIEKILKAGLPGLFGLNQFTALAGIAGQIGTGSNAGPNDWMKAILEYAGGGGVAFFGACLMFHEIFGQEGAKGMLKTAATAAVIG